MQLPDYAGGSIVNLIAELERRLSGGAPSPGLHPHLAATIPEAETYVVLLIDGLGAHQLGHPAASTLAGDNRATLDATFPSTTIVALASLATGLAPAGHGVLSHFLRIKRHGIVNALKWHRRGGGDLAVDPSGVLPGPNLWERLAAAGREVITVQPANFADSPTTKLLYRGARFEPAWTVDELLDATTSLAAVPGRLIFTYLPQVDLAAHTGGQASPAYAGAVGLADRAWAHITARLPDGAIAIATADHGHIDYADSAKIAVSKPPGAVYGDPRALLLRGERGPLIEWAADLPGTLVEDPGDLFGPGDHPTLPDRMPDLALFADEG
ncbi:MAG: hypothetical protein HKN46_01050, partial [Acidimicrobiia bacterium]|nr:hypothetical protein [Acidimicrobiia bacterium]